MNFGSGFVQVTPHAIELKLGIRREINPFIQRKYLSGNFTLKKPDFALCQTFFITSGNEKIPFRIYENSVLKYDGGAKINGEWDFIASTVSFNSFIVNDLYTEIETVLDNDEKSIEQLTFAGGHVGDFLIESKTAGCDTVVALSWNGTNWVVSGNDYDMSHSIGRVCCANVGSGTAVYDNATKELRRYYFTSPNWALSSLGTSLELHAQTGNASMCALDNTHILFVDDWFHIVRIYEMVTGTWTVVDGIDVGIIEYPSICMINN
jgi:hypothetical protein